MWLYFLMETLLTRKLPVPLSYRPSVRGTHDRHDIMETTESREGCSTVSNLGVGEAELKFQRSNACPPPIKPDIDSTSAWGEERVPSSHPWQ